MTRARFVPYAVALVALLGLQTGAPESTRAQPLAGRLDEVLRDAQLGERVGVAVRDLQSGEELFARRGDLPLNPASNQKLLTAAAALMELGPDFTMPTGLHGRVEDGAVADLVLRGYGDPSLRVSDLVQLAEALEDRGVRRVDRVWVDASYFDDAILPPAFEQQPGEMAAFRAAVGAVAVERASYVLRVVPGEVGATPTVRFAAPGYFEVDNGMTTAPEGAPNVIASQRALDDGRLSVRLRGSVPAGILGVGYRRRVEDPRVHAAHALAAALGRAGIRGRRSVRTGDAPGGLPLLASRDSATLAVLLHRVGKWSDNFVAEMLLKVLGAERRRPGTTAGGLAVLQDVLTQAGVAPGAATLVNGSGLFDGNLIAARHFVALLHHVYQQPGIRSEYLAHLAVGGSEGTLRRRLRDLPAPRIVRAKTGTLNDVIALSGYVLGPAAGSGVAFSVLVNGARGRQGRARALCDEVARTLAVALHGG
ncbi:MAG: D-alanyl-D-alanine carboxypeptidase/D-alanyl-D-alanine-endopeptidase [Myxococcota bacterium]